MRRGVELLREQKVVVFDGLVGIALAEVEARAGDVDRALAILNEALANASGPDIARSKRSCIASAAQSCSSEIRRIRLPPRKPSSRPSLSRSEQGTRSFQLRAALSLAKLYQLTGRPAEAHDASRPRSKAFRLRPRCRRSPKRNRCSRQWRRATRSRRGGAAATTTHLRVAYGHALIATRGYGAPETTEAFTEAREMTDRRQRCARALGGRIRPVGRQLRAGRVSGYASACGGFPPRRRGDRFAQAGVAHRVLGATHWSAGEYVEARDHLERALALFEPTRDDDLAFHFGQDARVAAMFYLAFALWPLGDVERAVSPR